MSTVDDLHYAEDTISELTGALHLAHAMLAEHRNTRPSSDVLGLLRNGIDIGTGYCRPSCEADDAADGGEYRCDIDCGCPCQHPLDPSRNE